MENYISVKKLHFTFSFHFWWRAWIRQAIWVASSLRRRLPGPLFPSCLLLFKVRCIQQHLVSNTRTNFVVLNSASHLLKPAEPKNKTQKESEYVTSHDQCLGTDPLGSPIEQPSWFLDGCPNQRELLFVQKILNAICTWFQVNPIYFTLYVLVHHAPFISISQSLHPTQREQKCSAWTQSSFLHKINLNSFQVQAIAHKQPRTPFGDVLHKTRNHKVHQLHLHHSKLIFKRRKKHTQARPLYQLFQDQHTDQVEMKNSLGTHLSTVVLLQGVFLFQKVVLLHLDYKTDSQQLSILSDVLLFDCLACWAGGTKMHERIETRTLLNCCTHTCSGGACSLS